jgi:hypothetical protein
MEFDFRSVLHMYEHLTLPSENYGFVGPSVELRIKGKESRVAETQMRKVKRGL